jgi:hypothetical protein
MSRPRRPGRAAIGIATVLLVVVAAGLFVVSVSAQYQYLLPARHNEKVPSAILAGSLDFMMITFSLLAFGLSRAGKPAPVERALIMACALASSGMNLSEANLGSPRSVAAYVVAPLALAVTIDRLIAVVYRFYTDKPERSAWSGVGRFGLYVLRLILAPWPTATGLRRMALAAAPVPGKPPGVVVVTRELLPLTTTTPGADHATTTDHDHTVVATTTTREADHDHATVPPDDHDHDHATIEAMADHATTTTTTGPGDHATTLNEGTPSAARLPDDHTPTTPDHERTTERVQQVTTVPLPDVVLDPDLADDHDHATTTTLAADHDHDAVPTTTTLADHATTTTGPDDHATVPTTTTDDHDHEPKATTRGPDHDHATTPTTPTTTSPAVSAPMPGAADVRFAQEAIAIERGIFPEQVPVREVAAYLEPGATRERLTKVGKYVSTVRGRDKAAQLRTAGRPTAEREEKT